MADVYYGASGDDNQGDGTKAKPYKNYSLARTASSSGDNLILLPGVLPHDADSFNFDQVRTYTAEGVRKARLQANPAESGTRRTARTSTGLAAANNPHVFEKFVCEGRDSDGVVTDRAFEILQDAVEDLEFRFSSLEAVTYGGDYGVYVGQRRGRIVFTDLKLSGQSAGATNLMRFVNASNDGNFYVNINGLEIELNDDADTTLVAIEGIDTLTNDFECAISGVKANVTVGASGSATVLDVRSADPGIIANCKITIDADPAATSVNGLLVRGQTTAIVARAELINNEVRYYAPAGYGLMLGQSQTDSHITAGRMVGNTVYGRYYETSTPHNMIAGQGTASEVRGNKSIGGYAGILLSITDSCTCAGNTVVDSQGPSIFVKGTVTATIQQNTIICTGAVQQRTNGLLACTAQGATNTAGADFIENLVIVADLSKVRALAQIEDASQVCTFVRNTYVIPDTVDITTEALFGYQTSLSVSEPNNTLAQWNAQTEVTNDRIIQLPGEQITRMIQDMHPDILDRTRIAGPFLVDKRTREVYKRISSDQFI